jgi:ubiquinone/menaquinone biosynthesis C-methylase UbiE
LVDGLLDAGYSDLVVVDIAEAALAKARERLGPRARHVRWIASDLLQWTPDAMFDIWHDRAVFHFMVRSEDRTAYLANMRRAVKRGGHVIIATFAANGPEKCSGLPIQRYEPDELAAQLGAEFRLVESLHEEHTTPGGKLQAFQYSRFQRVR